MSESESGIVRGPDGAIVSEEPPEVDEATVYPDRADPEYWSALGERLQELCEEADVEATFENMLECLRLHWGDLTKENRTIRKAKRRRLRRLKEVIQSRADSQQSIEDEIAQLESEVGNGG